LAALGCVAAGPSRSSVPAHAIPGPLAPLPQQVHTAFESAWRAADAVERTPGMDERTWVLKRKAAAESALKASLGGLGLNVQVGRGPRRTRRQGRAGGRAGAGAQQGRRTG
jgi:hypothetical protein